MPPTRAYVDPALPATLRELRNARGWSYRRLGRAAYLSGSYVCEIENATRRPTLAAITALDHALDADGALIAMVRESPTATGPEERDRIIHAVRRPTLLDSRAVDALAGVLAAHRHLDDLIPAHLLIPGELPQWETVQRLAKEARGPAVDELHLVAAEWTQYIGWLRAEARHDGPAVDTLTKGIAEARDIHSGPLTAQARNFLGYVARQRGDAPGIVRWFEGAYLTPGSTRLQRIGDAAQAAQGHALLGDHKIARRLLGEAQELALVAEQDEAPVAAYWLSVTYNRLNLGLAYLALGDHSEAEQQLQAGLDGIPPHHRSSEWAAEYRRALDTAKENA